MSTQDVILKTFIVYIFIKAMLFIPLAWMAVWAKINERSEGGDLTGGELAQAE